MTTALSSLRGLSPNLSMSDWAEQLLRWIRGDGVLFVSHPRGSENPSWTVILEIIRKCLLQQELSILHVVKLLTHFSVTSCGSPDSQWWESTSNRNKCTAENLHNIGTNYVNLLIKFKLHICNLSQYLFVKWCTKHFNRGLALWSTVSVKKKKKNCTIYYK